MTERPMDFTGTVVITWPRRKPGAANVLTGWATALSDPVTGEPITTVTAIEIRLHNDAQDLIWAELTMFADEDGKPIYDGMPVLRDGEVIYGTFPFLVSEMRVAACEHPGRNAIGGKCEACGEWYETTPCPECGLSRQLALNLGNPQEDSLMCGAGHRELLRVAET